MRAETTTEQTVLFPELLDWPLVAPSDERHGSYDSGAKLPGASCRRVTFIDLLVARVSDGSQAEKVDHAIEERIGQRVFALAEGPPDRNDAARIGLDPACKLPLDFDPIDGEPLAVHPTLWRSG